MFSDNDDFLALYELVEKSRPTYLVDMVCAESNDFICIKVPMIDTVGNTYSSNINNLFYTFPNRNIVYATYYLGGEYKRLVFDLAVSADGYSNELELTIIGNNSKVLYSSGLATRRFVPTRVEVDVSGYDWIQFKSSSNVDNTVEFIIFNPTLYKV